MRCRRGGEALERLRGGHWPSASVVTRVFGSWAAARVEAAARPAPFDARRPSAPPAVSRWAGHDVPEPLGRQQIASSTLRAGGPDRTSAQSRTGGVRGRIRDDARGGPALSQAEQCRETAVRHRQHLRKRNAWYGHGASGTGRSRAARTDPHAGSRDGLTRKMAEARLRRLIAEVTVTPLFEPMTVQEAGARLIQQLVTKGRSRRPPPATRATCACMWRRSSARSRSEHHEGRH